MHEPFGVGKHCAKTFKFVLFGAAERIGGVIFLLSTSRGKIGKFGRVFLATIWAEFVESCMGNNPCCKCRNYD